MNEQLNVEFAGKFPVTRVRFRRPRLLSEVVIVPVENGCLIDGSLSVRVLKADNGYPNLPEVLALLDGSRTMEELRAQPGIASDFVDSLVTQLSDWGLLEEAAHSAEHQGIPNQETLSFFRRFRDPAQNSKEQFEKLRASSVLIFARQSISDQVQSLKSLLENTGVGQVNFHPAESADLWLSSAGESTSLVVSLSLTGEDHQWFSSLDQWSHEKDRSWFRLVVDPQANYADVGPLFEGKNTACYQCFHAVHGKTPAETNASSYDQLFWISIAATEITFRLAQIVPVPGPGSFRRYDLQHWGSTFLFNTRVPGCSQCRPCNLATTDGSTLTAREQTDTSLVFEDYVAPKSLDYLRGLFYGSDAYVRSFAHEGKELPSCRALALTRLLPPFDRTVLDVMNQDEAISSRSSLSVKELSTLLLLSAGLREPANTGPQVRRWAPTAGNFGSVELFVVVRNIDGLLPGFYFYQSNEHALKFFERRRESLSVDEFMRRALGLGAGDIKDLPAALISLTGAFGRVATKYGAFGYKLINLDAGAAISQLCLAAAGLNINLRVVPYWADDVIEKQFNLRTVVEQSTALVAVSAKATGSIPSRSSIPSGRSRRPVKDFSGVTAAKLIEILYEDGRSRENEISSCLVPADKDTINPSDQVKPALSFPPPLREGISLKEAFANRRSVRYFAPRHISLEQLGTILSLASDFEIKNFPRSECEAEDLSFIVCALQVDQIAQGAYVYDRQRHSLNLLSEIRPGPEYAKIFVQHELAAAPLFIWITGNLAQACAANGAFGHRRLLMRAGAAAHALSMAAAGLGLAGTIVAGLIPAGGQALGIDGSRRASLVGFVGGYENLFPHTPELSADRLDDFRSIKDYE